MLKQLFLAIFLLLFLAFIAGGTLGGLAYYFLLTPVNAADTQTTRFVIPRGQSARVTGQRLADTGLLKNRFVLPVFIRLSGSDSNIQAGSFLLSPSMTPQQILETLAQGSEDLWITFPEGLRSEEMAEKLAGEDLSEFDMGAFMKQAAPLEGRLFPDTYLFPKSSTAESIIAFLTSTFDKKVEQGLKEEIESSEHDFSDALIMASIVQREEVSDRNMPLVAGILWNRVRIGMALQADATLQYAKGKDLDQGDWWVPPTALDKQRPSLFNTYLHPGLPPSPISNPGIAAIKAALQPEKTNALYYIHDRQGQLYTAETLPEHQQNVNKYLR